MTNDYWAMTIDQFLAASEEAANLKYQRYLQKLSGELPKWPGDLSLVIFQ